MRIRITAVTSVSDGAGRRYWSGQVTTVDDDLARAWIQAGHAVPADRATKTEDRTKPSGRKRTATRQAPNKAAPPATPPAAPSTPDS
ncbi:hypothetical protein [Streptomyces sp. NRRL F-5135]|uniref:hypothetical protein n=1 Tax=Streptomyces sp. NRRL F-5135 TaxID=1463858 RepID=UPI0004CBB71E|nr:hypothetical protein [Streptomyces sp. NRRL F-5135]